MSEIVGFYCTVCKRNTIFYHASATGHKTIPFNKDGQFLFDFCVRR